MPVEVKTKLTLDDDAIKSGLDDVADKVDNVEKAEKKANAGFKEWAQTASHVAQTLGVNLSDVIGKMKQYGVELLDIGGKAEAGDQAITALVSTAQGKSFDDALDKAEGLGDQLDEIAIKAGISGDALGNAFQSVLEKTGASEAGIASATEQIAKMATIASTLDKNVEGIAGEFAFMNEGTLKVKGQLFQLLQSTGIFGKHTKDAAEWWGKLTEGKRAELLAQGLSQLSSKMEKMPPTFKQAQASFENMVRISKEEVGQALIEELTPALKEATDELIKMGPEIKEFARVMAKEVGVAVREGGRMIKDAISWLREHKDEIAAGFREGAEKVKEVINFILAHKTELAIALGAKAVAPTVGKVAQGVGSAVSAVYQSGAGNTSGIGVGSIAGGGMAGGAVALAAFAAAIVAVGLAADQATKLLHELDMEEDRRAGGMRKLYEAAGKGDVEKVENTVNTMRQLDEAAGKLDPKMKKAYDNMIEMAHAQKDLNEAALRAQIKTGAQGATEADAMGGVKYSAGRQAQYDAFAQDQSMILLNAYNDAVKTNNAAMATLAAQTLAGGQVVGKAFLNSGKDVEGGFEHMADLLASGGGQFADFIKQLQGKGAAATPKAPVINMSGGQTFQIKQDFRQQDPDRVAIQFRRDIGKMAGRQLQSRNAGPFGG